MIGIPFGIMDKTLTQDARCFALNVFASSGTLSQAGFNLTRAGQIRTMRNGVQTVEGDYVSSGLPDVDVRLRFEVFVTQVSGPALSGSNSGLDVWLQINTTRDWSYIDAGGAFRLGAFDYQVREIAVPTNIAGPCRVILETEDGS